MRKREELADGHKHGFEPLERIDLDRISSFSDLTSQMARTSLAARQVGLAVDIMCAMFSDPHCTVVATLSGPMTVAKQDLVIADLIANGWIDAIVTTGAIIVHSLVQDLGKAHFKHDPTWDDAALYEAGYNRVYDTVELERSLDEAEELVRQILARRQSKQPLSSAELCHLLGEELIARGSARGILQEAHRHNIPIFIPAFTDSELGLDVAIYNNRCDADKRIAFDPFLDLDSYTELVSRSEHLGIFTIGGGVPRNWAQQVGPYVDSMVRRGVGDYQKLIKFKYGVRICPEPVHWGGLSGCTYSEGVSWGKFVAPEEGGRFAEVFCDATVVLPLVVLAVRERLKPSQS